MKEWVFNFEEACAKKGISTELPDVATFPEYLRKHVIALYCLSVILSVNNGDWVPDLADKSQCKYYPWFRINKEGGASGFSLSYCGCGCAHACTCLGVRLACKNAELAEYMGKNCAELYKDLFI